MMTHLKVTLTLWMVVVALFSFQVIVPLSKPTEDMIVSLMFGIFLFATLPMTVLTLVDIVKLGVAKRFKPIISYGFFVLIIYGVGALINAMLPQPIRYFSLKLLVVFHVIGLLWLSIYTMNDFLFVGLLKFYTKMTGKDMPKIVAIALYGLIFLLLYQSVRSLADEIPLMTWIFGQKVG